MKARQEARRKARMAHIAQSSAQISRRALAQAHAATRAAVDRHARILSLLDAAGGGSCAATLAAAAGIRAMLHPAADAALAERDRQRLRRDESEAGYRLAKTRADRLAEQAQAARITAALEAEATDLLNRTLPIRKPHP